MDEAELEAFLKLRPLRQDDVVRADAMARRCTALGVALWGRNSAALQRQLLAPNPEIPSGYELADFWHLLQSSQKISDALGDPRRAWLLPLARSAAIISVGSQQFTEWEARCEIVRRAIRDLENR